jgi:hypothetical protein
MSSKTDAEKLNKNTNAGNPGTIDIQKYLKPAAKIFQEMTGNSTPRAAAAEVSSVSSLAPTTNMDKKRKKDALREKIELEGLKQFFELRKRWSNYLVIALFIILAYNVLLVLAVGLGYLRFVDEWFLRIVLTANIADIIGLIYLVVKFLFTDHKDS